MSGHKIERISEDIKRELSSIFISLNDPRVSGKIISILKVSLAKDLSICRVFLSSINGIEDTKNVIKALKSASGHIKNELSQKVKLRIIPKLIFIPTDSIEYASKINDQLNNLISKD